MKNTPWQPGFTWRKLGFLSYADSLAYREIINMNPGWDVTKEPPIGAPVRYRSSAQSNGILTGTNTTFRPSNTTASGNIFPFKSNQEYSEAISAYQLGNVLQVDRLNGWSADSMQARFGYQ